MIEINDDILNRYIDGDLNEELMNEVKNNLASSPQNMVKYKMLLFADNKLKGLQPDEVSPGFTSNLMLRIQRSIKSKKEQNYFVISILSLLILISIGITGYLLAHYIFSTEPGSSDFFTRLTGFSESLNIFLKTFFSRGNLTVIGSVFSFILLISGYLFYDNLKHNRQK